MCLAVKQLINLSTLCMNTSSKHDHTSTYMESMVALIEHILTKTQARQKQHGIGPACADSCTRMHRIRLGGLGGVLPQEIILKI